MKVWIAYLLTLGFLTSTAMAALQKPSTKPNQGLAGERIFQFTYRVEVPAEEGQGPLDLFVPLAESTDFQTIVKRDFSANMLGEIQRDKVRGNVFWHGHMEKSEGRPIVVTVHYFVKRKILSPKALLSAGLKKKGQVQKGSLEKFLEPLAEEGMATEFIQKMQGELPKKTSDSLQRARSIYNYLVDNLEVRKVQSNESSNDPMWACSSKFETCSDLLSLFVATARAEGIPARIESGFPVPEKTKEGEVSKFGSWVMLHLDGLGWIPVDMEKALNNKNKKDNYFGRPTADRIAISSGRGVDFGKGQSGSAQEPFVYPRFEVDRKLEKTPKTSLSFRELKASELAQEVGLTN